MKSSAITLAQSNAFVATGGQGAGTWFCDMGRYVLRNPVGGDRSCLGAWIARTKPEFGPEIAASFQLMSQLDRRRVPEAMQRREHCFRPVDEFLGPSDLLCMPTTPAFAPRKGDPPIRSLSGTGYYARILSLTSVAGICRLPQVSGPIATEDGIPVGLSLLAKHGQDAFLLDVAETLCWRESRC